MKHLGWAYNVQGSPLLQSPTSFLERNKGIVSIVCVCVCIFRLGGNLWVPILMSLKSTVRSSPQKRMLWPGSVLLCTGLAALKRRRRVSEDFFPISDASCTQ